MCIAYYSQQPVCDCIYVSGVVVLCCIFSGLPENSDKTTFSPKLITGHCQGLDLYFDGINYTSVDMETYDIVPNGLDCPEVELREDGAPPGQCPLCNSEGAKKYFNAKSIRYTSTPDKAARDLQNKAAERGLENARARAAGKSVATSVGELADKLVESSLGKGVVVNEARKWEVMSSGGNRQEGKKPLR